MKQFLTVFLLFRSWLAFAANPAFSDFDGNQFGTTGNKLTIKSGASITNASLINPSLTSVSNLSVTATAAIADLVVSNSLSVGVLNVSTLNYFTQTNYAQYSVATLPTPVGIYAIVACTNAVTSRGVGDLVIWNGSVWTTRENVTPSETILDFIVNAKAAGLNVATPISRIQFVSDQFLAANSVIGRAYAAGGTSAGAAGFAANNIGSYIAYNTGSTAVGYGHAYGIFTPSPVAGDYLATGGQYAFSAIPSNADIYFAIAAGSVSLNTTNIPVSGAFFLYDMFNVTGLGLTTSASNNWIAVSTKAGVSSSTDTGLAPSTTTTGPQRLMTVITTTAVYFYTNNVLAVTVSDTTKIPAVAMYDRKAGMFKAGGSTGTTDRDMKEWTPYVNHRHAARTW